MADFNKAVQLTLQHEGGFVDDPSDPGGATNMGIEQRDVPAIPIHNLSVAQAIGYYRDHFWPSRYSEITSQAVASKLFDLGVLFGAGTAVKALQAIFVEYGIEADGIFGPRTLDIVNTAEPVGLLVVYKKTMEDRAVAIAVAHPQEAKFLQGWVRRINS